MILKNWLIHKRNSIGSIFNYVLLPTLVILVLHRLLGCETYVLFMALIAIQACIMYYQNNINTVNKDQLRKEVTDLAYIYYFCHESFLSIFYIYGNLLVYENIYLICLLYLVPVLLGLRWRIFQQQTQALIASYIIVKLYVTSNAYCINRYVFSRNTFLFTMYMLIAVLVTRYYLYVYEQNNNNEISYVFAKQATDRLFKIASGLHNKHKLTLLKQLNYELHFESLRNISEQQCNDINIIRQTTQYFINLHRYEDMMIKHDVIADLFELVYYDLVRLVGSVFYMRGDEYCYRIDNLNLRLNKLSNLADMGLYNNICYEIAISGIGIRSNMELIRNFYVEFASKE